MKKINRLFALIILCACIVIPFAGCDDNPYYNGKNIIQSYELEQDGNDTWLYVTYNSELVNEEDTFLALFITTGHFEYYECNTLNSLLKNNRFVASQLHYDHYPWMIYLAPGEPFHASTYTPYYAFDDIAYITIYNKDAYELYDSNTDLLKYVGIIEVK